jgi:FkbM family methyltransferase
MPLLTEKVSRTFGFISNHPVGKKHPFKSLMKFALWQLQTVIAPSKFFIKDFIKPVKFYARKKLTGITGNIYVGLHEFNDMAFLLHFLRSGDVFFDIGANVGAYTLLASGICKAKSIALEPVTETYDLLGKNIRLNNLQDRAQHINAAAGASAGTITFSAGEDTTNHVIADDEQYTNNTTEVNVITVDSLSAETIPALIKIDVEGYETEVLKGMADTLKQNGLKAIIIELNGSGLRYGYDESKIHELLLDKGFIPYSYEPFSRELTPINAYNDHNTIYCRDINFIRERILQAEVFTIFGENV